jgi:hypothetical protein
VAAKEPIVTVYSNIMNVRVTPLELVLEFGTFFPEGPAPPAVGPREFNPELRVVMNAGALSQLIEGLSKAAEAQKTALHSQTQPPTAKAQ